MKVYVSKSNVCNYDDVLFVKSLLRKFKSDIIEHDKPPYNPNLVTSADITIFILPYENPLTIGKGQFEEYYRSKGETIVYYNNSFYKISQCLKINPDNYQRHAVIKLGEEIKLKFYL